MNPPRWTITALTIPGREPYLARLLRSLEQVRIPGGGRLVVVYNRPVREGHSDLEQQIRALAPALETQVYFNSGDPTISGGRNFQLNVCKTPLICFVDDDLSVHGDPFVVLEQALQEHPVGLVGLRSYVGDSDEQFKPRDTTPFLVQNGFRYQNVQGMLAAGYTSLFRDVGGFNPRRRFWGEWTELNLRLWRSGFPTGMVMLGGFLRHWEDAPDSPTRNLPGRAAHVLWGLICTALEYDVVEIKAETESFWRLVEERYLAYSFGEDLSPRELLRATLELMPLLSRQWGEIVAFRELVARHPFPFMPFHALTAADLNRVLPAARRAVREFRDQVWPQPPRAGLLRRVARAVSGKHRRRDTPHPAADGE